MFERLSNGWELARESLAVLRKDKQLLVFPFISSIACLAVLASFAVPLWFTKYLQVLFEGGGGDLQNDPAAWAILFAFYAVNYFVIVFFNSALVGCAVIRFKGGEPTLRDGLRAATNRLPQIVAWSLVSATVGVILRAIESWSEKAGQIAAALLGAGWSIATYFVVPVLVVEHVGPIDAVQRSLSILKRTWGEALGANFGIGFIIFLASLIGVVPFVGGIFAMATGNVILGAILLTAGLLWLMVVALVSSALDTILLAALYLYAAEGTVPRGFNESVLGGAFSRE
jgi:hypothetical protein